MGKRPSGSAASATTDDGRAKKRAKPPKKTPAAKKGRVAAAKKVGAPPVFFMCPGAGGTLPADKPGEPARSIKTLLAEIGDVAGPMDKPPMGGGGCSAKALAAFLAELERVCARYRGRDVWLATQSFGGRLAVHTSIGAVENRDATGKPKPWPEGRPLPAEVQGIVAFGYPLYHAKQNRAAPLLELPKGTRMMFVMGEKDEVALGKPVNKGLLTSKPDHRSVTQQTTLCTSHRLIRTHLCARNYPADGRCGDRRAAVGAIWGAQPTGHPEDAATGVQQRDPGGCRSVCQRDVTRCYNRPSVVRLCCVNVASLYAFSRISFSQSRTPRVARVAVPPRRQPKPVSASQPACHIPPS
jgi:hypothetical protein